MGEDTAYLLEKSAVLQRDGETYALTIDMPAGLISPEKLRTIADVSEKYSAAAIKVTSAQRIVIIGIREEEIDDVWNNLGMVPGEHGLSSRTHSAPLVLG